MHNLKEIRKDFSKFEKDLEKRSVKIDFNNLKKLDELNRDLIQKKEILENYLKEGIGFDIIPADIVEEYGIADVQSTYEVAVSQSKQEGKSIEQIAAYTVPVFWGNKSLSRNGEGWYQDRSPSLKQS